MFKERILILSLILIIFILLANYFLPSKDSDAEEEKVFWIKKTHQDNDFDWVFIGDSRIYRGISDSVINEIIPNIKILNFGYSSGSLSRYMLKNANSKLKESSKNKTIILGVTPHSLTPKANKDEHLMQELNKKREEIIDAFYLYPVKKYFKTTTLLLLFRHLKGIEFKSNLPIYFQEYKENGWVASWKQPEDTTEAFDAYRSVFINNKCSEKIFLELLDEIQILRQKGIKVYAFRPPSSKTMEQIEDSLSGFNETKIRLSIESVGGIWIPMKKEKYRSYDGSHLRKDGAILLSKDIALFIKENY